MPDVTITAHAWTIDRDVDSPLTAAQFTARYVRLNGMRVWDPTIYDGISLYRGQATPDLVIIEAEFDGETREVIRGVVDRSGREQTAAGVEGTLEGRDSLALLLDRYPFSPFTIAGLDVVGETPVARQRFSEAVRQVCTAAGVPVLFYGLDASHDYAIGRSVPVTTGMTFGRVLEDLLQPLRLSARHTFDAWMEGGTLVIAKRGTFGDVLDVHYERLIVDAYEKTPGGPIVNDVQVLGATYEVLVPDPGALGGCEPVVVEEQTVEQMNPMTGMLDPAASYTETRTTMRDARCQVTRIVMYRQYFDNLRLEERRINYTYGDPAHPEQKTSEEEVYSVADNRSGNNPWFPMLKEVSRTTRTFSYYADNGDLQTEEVNKEERDESAESELTLPLVRKETQSYRYIRGSRGYVWRLWETKVTDLDPATGNVVSQSREFGSSEQGAIKLSQGVGSIVPSGLKQETRQIACGADTAQRKVTNELIGDVTAACAIRSDILDDHSSIRVDIRVRMAPDHRVLPGRMIRVLGAPAWWDVTQFLVLASSIEVSASGAEQTVRAVAWVAAA